MDVYKDTRDCLDGNRTYMITLHRPESQQEVEISALLSLRGIVVGKVVSYVITWNGCALRHYGFQ